MSSISIKFTPHTIQKQIIEGYEDADNKFIIAKCGRRLGKSFVGTYLLLRHMLSIKNSRGIYVAPTFKLCLEMFNLMVQKIQDTPLVKSVSRSDFRIDFHNGSVLEYFSGGNPDAIRGRTCDIGLIDEACFISDYAINECILPCFSTSKNPKIIFISTPRFKKGAFYEYYTKGLKRENKCISYSAPSSDSPYVNSDFLELMQTTLPERVYKCEILAEFLDAGDGLFKYQHSKINKLSEYGKCYYGIDLGKSDKSSLTILSDRGETLLVEEFSGSDYTVIMHKMLHILKQYNIDRGYVETNGPGSPFYDFFRKELRKIEPWVTTNTTKNKMIEDLMVGFEKGGIKILDTYYELLGAQMDNVTCDYNPTTRNIRYLFGRDEDGHCDSVVSLALAYQALSKYHKTNKPKIQVR